MTVGSGVPYNSHEGNGVTRAFAYGFTLLDEDDFVATINGAETTAYTLTGIGNPAGGSCIFTTAPADGAQVILERVIVSGRAVDYPDNGDLPAGTLNSDFDRLWMYAQGALANTERALRMPIPETAAVLPALADRKGMLLGFDSESGAPIVVSLTAAAERQAQDERYVATGGETDIDLSGVTYSPGLNTLMVFRNGLKLRRGIDYDEISTTRYRLKRAAAVGDEFEVVAGTPLNASSSALASLITFTPTGTGAVGASVEDWLRKFPKVSDYSTVAQAVARCYAVGLPLYWDGAYTTTATIPNFHDVRHIGKGTHTRGSDVWTVGGVESTTYTLYVATTGSDTNDGLTAAYPLLTVQKALDIIKDRAPLSGRYTISLAAGTYSGNVTASAMLYSDHQITIQGPSVGGTPNVPTAIISATDVNSPVFTCSSLGWFNLVDLKLTGSTNESGAYVNGSTLRLQNVHITACLHGVTSMHGAQVTVLGGIWTGRGKAVANGRGYRSFYNETHTFSATGYSDCTTVEAYAEGLTANEGSQGHFDYAIVQDCGTGLLLQRGAGECNTDSVKLLRNDLGIDARCGWYDSNIVFGTGGDANTLNVKTRGNAPEYVYRVLGGHKTVRRAISTSIGAAHTGTTTQTTVYTWAGISDWMSSEGGDSIDIDLCITSAGLAGTLTVRLSLYDGTTNDDLTSVVLPIGTTTGTVRALIDWRSVSSQLCVMTATSSAANVAPAIGFGALNLKGLAGTIRVKYTLSNAADSVTTQLLQINTTFGG